MTWPMTSGASWSPCFLREEGGTAADVGKAAAHRRDPVAGPGGGAVAGRPAGADRPWQSVYGLFRRWQLDGTWGLIIAALQVLADAAGHVTWDVSVDSGTARAHQHAAGARKDGVAQKEPPGGGGAPEPGDHALGRSRGGLTSKFHLAVEQGQKPLSVIVTAGQRGDSPQFIPVLEKIRIPAQAGAGPGRGRTWSWPTRPTDRPPTAPGCAATGSAAPSRRRPTRSRTGRRRAAPEDGAPPSTRKSTSSATPWNAGSTGSSATVPSPPATTSSPSATRQHSTSPPSANGSGP